VLERVKEQQQKEPQEETLASAITGKSAAERGGRGARGSKRA
jgi:hypothetical protein